MSWYELPAGYRTKLKVKRGVLIPRKYPHFTFAPALYTHIDEFS